MLLNLGINVPLKYSSPLFLISNVLVKIPPARGITTNKTTDRIRVSQGIETPLTPSRNATIGVKAISIMRSLVAT